VGQQNFPCSRIRLGSPSWGVNAMRPVGRPPATRNQPRILTDNASTIPGHNVLRFQECRHSSISLDHRRYIIQTQLQDNRPQLKKNNYENYPPDPKHKEMSEIPEKERPRVFFNP